VLIALFFTYNYSLKTWSDSGILLKELEIYEMLNRKHGIKFKFITYGYKDEESYIKKFDFIEIIPIYEYISKSKFKLINYIKSFLIPFKIKSLLADVTLFKQHQLLGSWVSILSKFINKKPLIIRTGYDMFLFSIYEKKSMRIKFLYYFLTLLSLRFANLYTIASTSDSNKLRKYFKYSKVKIRRNWIKEVKNIKNLDKRHSDRVLSVGRLEKQKNYSYLIDSLSNSKYSIDIVGKGSLKESLKKESGEKNVKLKLLDPIENESLLEVYQDYKYFILTSFYEGNPKALIEAMSSGCIVLASNIENNSEIIDNYINGILVGEGLDSILNALDWLDENPDKASQISTNATNFIHENYLLSDLVEKEYEDYKNLTRNIN
tara:strand:+ start:13244 stop:14371 length:1128 start_codon:yes stop_codon:yes gene_type:complete